MGEIDIEKKQSEYSHQSNEMVNNAHLTHSFRARRFGIILQIFRELIQQFFALGMVTSTVDEFHVNTLKSLCADISQSFHYT